MYKKNEFRLGIRFFLENLDAMLCYGEACKLIVRITLLMHNECTCS